MKRVIALLMENQPGALSRVVGLFSQRGYNIESLIVAPTDDPSLSRLTMVTEGDAKAVEQITKQLNKLIDVVKVVDLSEEEFNFLQDMKEITLHPFSETKKVDVSGVSKGKGFTNSSASAVKITLTLQSDFVSRLAKSIAL